MKHPKQSVARSLHTLSPRDLAGVHGRGHNQPETLASSVLKKQEGAESGTISKLG